VDGTRVLVFDNFGNYLRDLVGTSMHQHLSLYANNDGVMVIDSTNVLCFDKDERPVCSLPIAEVVGTNSGEVRSFAFSQDSIFVLGSKGLFSVPHVRW